MASCRQEFESSEDKAVPASEPPLLRAVSLRQAETPRVPSDFQELEELRAENRSLRQLLRSLKHFTGKKSPERELLAQDRRAQRKLDRQKASILEMVASHAPLSQTLEAIAALATSGGGLTGAAVWKLSNNALSLQAIGKWPGVREAALTTVSLDGDGEISEASCGWFEDRVRRAAASAGTGARFVLLRDAQGRVIGLLVAFGREEETEGPAGGVVMVMAHLASLAIESSNLYERLAFHAQHDVLTGLPNRLMFQESVESALALADRTDQKVAVLWIDLDRFKQINDTFGHKAGDELLVEVARRLRRCVHPTDTVARLGGDEFTIVICQAPDENVVEAIASRLLKAICGPMTLNGHEVRISASIGMSLSPDHGTDAGLLMRHADLAMYHAKRSGRNQCQIFLREFGHSQLRHAVIEEQLRGALECEEFHLEYQPLTGPGGEIAGVEALLRWVNPKLGSVPPAEFIPIAEEMGLIVDLGRWVTRTACRDGASWIESGCELANLSINVSALQLADKDFAAMICQALADFGFPARKLELEVTETVLIRDLERVLDQIARLRALGVRFSIDDFGKGYSSLNRLRTLPVDILKIDNSFIKEIEQLESNTLVRGIIVLAHSLDLKVVAEGVETEAQLNALRSMGCDRNQGFHLYRPMEASAVESLLAPTGSKPGSLVLEPVS
jgi:diguanylate cyclase (GGDEF)-like protein